MLKTRYEVIKSDMNDFKIKFDYAGLFQSVEKWCHPERCEKTHEIIHVLKGEFSIEEEQRVYHLSKGDTLLLSKNMLHKGVGISENVEFYWVHFHLLEEELPFKKRLFSIPSISPLFRELLHFSNLPEIPKELVNSILLHILYELEYFSKDIVEKFNPLAEKLYEWLRTNANAKTSVKSVAEKFGYSTDHLTRICKENFNTGLKELIDKFIIIQAKEALLNSNAYVKEIAKTLSFSSDKAFIGFFKYHEGHSPTEFRKSFSKIHMNAK